MRCHYKNLSFKNHDNALFHQLFFVQSILFGTFNKKGYKLLAKKKLGIIKFFLKQELNTDPNIYLFSAIYSISPNVFIATINAGGSRYGVPLPIFRKKKVQLALKWLKEDTKNVSIGINHVKFVRSLLTLQQNTSEYFKKRDIIHNQATESRYLMRFFR